MMPRRALAALLLPLLAASVALGPGCGGGPSGTARSTIQGNVAEVEHALRRRDRVRGAREILLAILRPISSAWAQTGLEDIRVSIEGTPYETRTGPDGGFVLVSPYAGDAILLFERENEALVGRLAMFVPEGATVSLRDVRCSQPVGACQADEVVVEEAAESTTGLEAPEVGGAPSGPPTEAPDSPRVRGPSAENGSPLPNPGPPLHAGRPGTEPGSGSNRPDVPGGRGSRESGGGPPPGKGRPPVPGAPGNAAAPRGPDSAGGPNAGVDRGRPESPGRANGGGPPEERAGGANDPSNRGGAGMRGRGAAR